MCPNEEDKHWRKQVSRYPNLLQESEHEATLSPEEIANSRVSVEGYEQDQRARDSLKKLQLGPKMFRHVLHGIRQLMQSSKSL